MITPSCESCPFITHCQEGIDGYERERQRILQSMLTYMDDPIAYHEAVDRTWADADEERLRQAAEALDVIAEDSGMLRGLQEGGIEFTLTILESATTQLQGYIDRAEATCKTGRPVPERSIRSLGSKSIKCGSKFGRVFRPSYHVFAQPGDSTPQE